MNKGVPPAATNPLPVSDFWEALEAGNYGRTWDKTAPYFQRDQNRDEWIARMEKERRPLGKLVDRKLVSTTVITPLTRTAVEILATFANGQQLVEGVISAVQPDGEWRVEKYYTRPATSETMAKVQANLARLSRFSNIAIWGGCLVIMALFIGGIGLLHTGANMTELPVKALVGLCFLPAMIPALAATLLGWIAVSQIRRSAGKLHGLWLAVFDGLLFPLLAVDGLVLSGYVGILNVLHLRPGMILLPPMLLAVLVLDWFILRRVWRTVNAGNAGGPPAKTGFPRWAVAALAVVGLAVVGGGAFFYSKSADNADPASLADSPFKLRERPTAMVIKAGLAKPISPWAWQELEKRHLSREEVAQIMAGATAWLRREYPDGASQPLSWLDSFLKNLRENQLMTDQQAIDFVLALHGKLRGPALARIHEGERTLNFDGECRNIWSDRFLGFYLLNEIQSATVDEQPVKMRANFGRNWQMDHVNATLELPTLAPGRHQVKIVSLAALVHADDVDGMDAKATAADWPPAVKRWLRTNEIELVVYAAGAQMVDLTTAPALDPVEHGFGIKSAVVRRKGGKPLLMVTFQNPKPQTVDLSFKVTAQVGGQNVAGGGLWIRTREKTQSFGGLEQSTVLSELSPEVNEVEIRLTPDPLQVEAMAEIQHIWGKEIRFAHVPLKRLDLPATAPKLAFGPVVERMLTGDPGLPPTFLSLNDGSLVYSPTGTNLSSAKAFADWWRGTKADFMAAVTGDKHLLVSLEDGGANFAEFPAEKWESASMAEVDDALRKDSSLQAVGAGGIVSYILPKPTTTPLTLAVESRTGEIGLLQITGFTENPRGVKLRYKLVPSAAPSNAFKPIPPEAVRLWNERNAWFKAMENGFIATEKQGRTNNPAAYKAMDQEYNKRGVAIAELIHGTRVEWLAHQHESAAEKVRSATEAKDSMAAKAASEEFNLLRAQIEELFRIATREQRISNEMHSEPKPQPIR